MPSSFATSPFSTRSSKKARSSGALLQQRLERELQQPLGQRRVVGEIGERDLRLDHPELGEMAAGVGVLGAERRPERVDLGEREAVGLDVELPRHGQERLAAEEILARNRPCPRGVRGRLARSSVDTRNSCARAFGVGRGDDRRVDPEEAVLVEEAMDRLRQRVAHARRRADHVGARPQMRDLAQELHRVRLRLDRIGVRVVDPADHLDRARLHLERLALGRRRHDRAGRLDRAAGGELQDLVGVVRQRVRRDHLHRMERRAVRQVHERDAGLGVAPGAHPALDRDRRVLRRLAGQDRAHVELAVVHCFPATA